MEKMPIPNSCLPSMSYFSSTASHWVTHVKNKGSMCKHTTEKVPLVDQLRKKKKERKGGKVDGIESNSQYKNKVKTDRKVGLPLTM